MKLRAAAKYPKKPKPVAFTPTCELVGASLRLVLPAISTSINRTHGQHWSVTRKQREIWRMMVSLAIRNFDFETAPIKRHVLIERHNAGPGLDRDNLYGSYKQLIDALKDHRLIVDDSDQWLELKCTNVQSKRADQMTVVTISEHEPSFVGGGV